MKLQTWLKLERGRGISLAAQIGFSQPTVSDWGTEKKAIPAEHCKTIERLTGGLVTCQEMRPHDWHKYWPELVQEQKDPEAQQTRAQAATQTVAVAAVAGGAE